MLLVVDTNVLFVYFWKNSSSKDLFKLHKMVSPEISLAEIKKYESTIIEKAGISKEEFESLRKELIKIVEFIPEDEYKNYFKKATSISINFKEHEKKEFNDDIDFFALALKLNCPIWSNDKLLKKQSIILIFNSSELIELSQ